MTKSKKENMDTTTTTLSPENIIPSINDVGWTDYVLSLMSEDEKIKGNPTTDGLRRIFEIALNCELLESSSLVVQSPSPDNEKRATVIHNLTYSSIEDNTKLKRVSGAADVYWGNCDKIYRNHPVAVAETRAEGRALRRALKLRKVVAAEELVEHIEDHPDGDSVNKISNNQLNFIDVMAKRLDINVIKLLNSLAINNDNVYNISHDDGVKSVQSLSGYQTSIDSIPSELRGYDANWK